MNTPYRLLQFESKKHELSSQGKSILEFCVSNSKFENFIDRIKEEQEIEKESIKILKRAILAEYFLSDYAYGWSKAEELEFWKLVDSKCNEQNRVFYILAIIQTKTISLLELKELYFKAFDQNIEGVFSIDDNISNEFYNHNEIRYEFLKYEFRARITQYEDFEDNWKETQKYWENKFENDEKAFLIMDQMLLDRRLQEKGIEGSINNNT